VVQILKSGSAEQGYDRAQLFLGNLLTGYYEGRGKIDFEQGRYWLTKAANQGNPEAQYCLGLQFQLESMNNRSTANNSNKQAIFWWTKAAEKGHMDAQEILAMHYGMGRGVPQNDKFAYVWWSLAAAQGAQKAASNRDFYKNKLSPQQLAEAQDLAIQIQHKIDHPTESQQQNSGAADDEKKVSDSGTGFLITKDGYILTCHHVIEDANKIKVVLEENTFPAELVRDDPNNDLALLKIDGSFPAIAFSSERSAKMGENVFTVGYPNPSLQGVNPKLTKGTINSLTGFQDDLRLYQVDIPVQPGNSGGALLDENGNVIGVIMAMLDAKTTFNITGSLPQNVNYAVKSTYALAMLDTLPEIHEKLVSPSNSKSNAVDRATESTVIVICYK